MSADFDERRKAAREKLDLIDPAKTPGGDPFRRAWFNAVYDLAADDPAAVPWASLAPHVWLADWLAAHGPLTGRAVDVGCGLGDNAEALAAAGAQTAAFDLSARAVDWARRRFPQSSVDYRAADLFALPQQWRGAFDFVHECQTLQALPESLLPQAAAALASLVKPGGRLLVIARARDADQTTAGPPWPLIRANLEALAVDGLSLLSLEDLAAPGETRYWRALYRREA